jgi:hypothetical protein
MVPGSPKEATMDIYSVQAFVNESGWEEVEQDGSVMHGPSRCVAVALGMSSTVRGSSLASLFRYLCLISVTDERSLAYLFRGERCEKVQRKAALHCGSALLLYIAVINLLVLAPLYWQIKVSFVASSNATSPPPLPSSLQRANISP